MDESKTRDAARSHENYLVNAVRFSALSPREQLQVCPSFISVPQMLAEIRDDFEVAEEFQRNSNEPIMDAEAFEELRQFVARTIAVLQKIPEYDHWPEFAESNAELRDIRITAHSWLSAHGWGPELDMRFFRYVDPKDGKTKTPYIEDRLENE